MRSELKNFWQYLQEYHQSEAKAIRQKILAQKFGISARAIREWTEELTVDFRKPVASTVHPPYGIFVATTQGERERYIAQLDARMKALYRRRRAFARTPIGEVIRQMELEMTT